MQHRISLRSRAVVALVAVTVMGVVGCSSTNDGTGSTTTDASETTATSSSIPGAVPTTPTTLIDSSGVTPDSGVPGQSGDAPPQPDAGVNTTAPGSTTPG